MAPLWEIGHHSASEVIISKGYADSDAKALSILKIKKCLNANVIPKCLLSFPKVSELNNNTTYTILKTGETYKLK